MRSDTLHIVTCVANPIRWESRIRLALSAIRDWLKEPNVHVTVVECAYGARGFDLGVLSGELGVLGERVTHVPVRATTLVWNKECLINLGIQRLPHDARYIGVFDADIHFRKPGWANETIHALDLYPVVQPWKTAYDLGPNDSHHATHTSFASLFHDGKPVFPAGPKFWKSDGGSYDYAHSGFAWAFVREILDRIGGLFELGGMGSGDHHMALAIAGAAEKSMPGGTDQEYRDAVMLWQQRALTHINGKLGFVPTTIEHQFHGSKRRRYYTGRWDMFVHHQFSPSRDLKRNTYGVLEFAGGKPDLEREFDRYLRSRMEDGNLEE